MVKRVLSVVGVFFLYFLVFFIGAIGFLLWSEGKFSITEEQFYNYGTCFGKVVTALFVVWFSHVKGISKDLDSRRNRRFIKMIGVAILFVCIVKIMAQSFIGVLLSGILSTHCNVSYEKTIIDYIDIILLAPVTEELFFRKGLYGYAREKLNISIAVILTSLMFAAVHEYNLQGFLCVFFGGIFLALIYEHSGNIMYSICSHMMLNVFVCIANALKEHGLSLYYNLNGYIIYTLPVILTAILLVTIILIKGRMKIGKRKIQSACS